MVATKRLISRYSRMTSRPSASARKTYRKFRRIVKGKTALKRYKNPRRIGQRLPGYPKNDVVCTTFTSNNLIQLGVGSNEIYPFSCNRAAFPVDGSTHQPQRMDLWTKIYNHYMVVRAKIQVTFLIPAATVTATATPMTYFIRIDDDSTLTGVGSADQYRIITQTGKTHYRTVMQGSVPQRITLTGWYTPRSFFGIVDPLDCQTRVGGSLTPRVDPPELAYWLVGGITNDNSITGVNDVAVETKLTYYIKFSEPNDQSVIS